MNFTASKLSIRGDTGQARVRQLFMTNVIPANIRHQRHAGDAESADVSRTSHSKPLRDPLHRDSGLLGNLLRNPRFSDVVATHSRQIGLRQAPLAEPGTRDVFRLFLTMRLARQGTRIRSALGASPAR